MHPATRPRILRQIGGSVALAAVAACGGSEGGTTDPETPTPTPSSVSLSPASDTLHALGATLVLQATVRDQFGKVMSSGPAPSWSSSNPSVATVVGGVVTAASNGFTTVVATAGTASGSARIGVAQRPAGVLVTGGDNQTAEAESALPTALRIRVEDARGHPVPGTAVVWSVESGGGRLSQIGNTTDEAGTASARWTLGPEEGSQSVRASADDVSAGFRATATIPDAPLVIDALTPPVLREGAEATLQGTGLQDAAVTVGGVPAVVLSSTPDALTFSVPFGGCEPTHSASVQARQGSRRAARTATVEPAWRLEPLEFGETWMSFGTGDEGHCLHLEGHGAQVRYLIGVQSLSESVSALTPASLGISRSMSASEVGASLESPTGGGSRIHGLDHRRLQVQPAAAPLGTPDVGASAPRLDGGTDSARRDDAHLEHLTEILELAERLRQSLPEGEPRLRSPAVPVAAGDPTTLRVPESCEVFTSIAATVKAVGTRAIWIEDDARPAQGFTDQYYRQIADEYDAVIGAELNAYLGAPTDVDGNGKVVIVVSPAVNAMQSTLGFMHPVDLAPTSTCPSSNEGEYFYVRAPDPGGSVGDPVTASDLQSIYPSLLGHEMTHVVHISQQMFLPGSTGFPTTWESEGFATFLEQLVGHRYTGYGSGENLGLWAWDSGEEWYYDMISDLAFYFGFESQSSRVSAAPHECSWLGRPPNGPCLNASRMPYGVPASLYRWIADYAWSPATEAQMTRAVVRSTVHGQDLLADLASEDLQWVMAFWAIALAADDRYFGGGSPTFSSWDLNSIFNGLHPTARLEPRPATYDSFTPFNVRGGSVAYFTVAGAHPELAIAAADLPPSMRLWIVRVE